MFGFSIKQLLVIAVVAVAAAKILVPAIDKAMAK